MHNSHQAVSLQKTVNSIHIILSTTVTNIITEKIMIKSFAHKGLEDLFYGGTTKGVQQKHVGKLHDILDLLDNAAEVDDMNFPDSKLHPLKEKLKGN